MAFSWWICSRSTKNMFVKIVHPGGHVELHDRPILAAEIIYRNPKCVVAHPHVFQQPWAIVASDTELMLGQKFYVVPVSTIRKLQRHSNKCSPSPVRPISTSTESSQKSEEHDPLDMTQTDSSSTCWFFMNINNSSRHAGKGVPQDMEKVHRSSWFSNKNCFTHMKTSVKSTSNDDKDDIVVGDDSGDKTRSPSNFISHSPDHDHDQTRGHVTRWKRSARRHAHAKGSPKRQLSFEYHWQPSLTSITESTDE